MNAFLKEEGRRGHGGRPVDRPLCGMPRHTISNWSKIVSFGGESEGMTGGHEQSFFLKQGNP